MAAGTAAFRRGAAQRGKVGRAAEGHPWEKPELLQRHGHGARRERARELLRAGEKGSLLQPLTRRRSREEARSATRGAASGPGSLSSAMEMGIRAWAAEGTEGAVPAAKPEGGAPMGKESACSPWERGNREVEAPWKERRKSAAPRTEEEESCA
jgi:hypothetical protein